MNKKVILLIGSVVFLCISIAIMLLGREDVLAGIQQDDQAANPDIEIIEGLKVTSEYRLEEIINPYFMIHEDPEEAKERFELRVVDAVLKNENAGAYPTIYLFDYKDNILYWISRSAPAPLDASRMLILFREPGPDGEMVPCLVSGIRFQALGKTDGLLSSRRSYRRELSNASIDGYHAKIYSDLLYHKRADEYDSEKHGPSYVGGVYGMSVLLSESAPPEFDSLIMGELYGVSLTIPVVEEEFDYGYIVLRLPEDIPKGKTVVFEVDVTQDQNYHDVLNRNALERSLERRIRFRLNYYSRRPYGFRMRFQAENANGNVETTDISPNGSTMGGVDELGGRLIVSVGDSRMSYMIYYLDRLESREITLPDDADIVVDPNDLLSFELEVPYNRMPENALKLCLLLDEESPLYVATGRFGSLHEIDHELEDGYQPESIPMKSLPGEYYVTYSGRSISLAARSHDASRVIGRVIISEEDEGKTLRVLPLE